MKVLLKHLQYFTPLIDTSKRSVEEIAQIFTSLGFEAEPVDPNDAILELSVTPNRADAMSHLGLARDFQAFVDTAAKLPAVTINESNELDNIPSKQQNDITITSPAVTSQYHAVLFENVTIQPSPTWLQDNLRLLGLRPINNVVDVTNWLMELYGQPLHAFDADSIKGGMIVRASKTGETLETLDGTVHTLPEGVTVIEDDSGLIDLAGIRGGKSTEIRPETKRVLLQSAIFDRARIRKAVNALNYRTAASTRFERGVDPAISLSVLSEAVRLLTSSEFGSAQAVGKQLVVTDTSAPLTVQAKTSDISKLIGLDIPTERQTQLLKLLGCTVSTDGDIISVVAPSWRFDLNIWQDLAEEVARLTGLDQEIPAISLPPTQASTTRSDIEWAEALKDRLVSIGLSEVQTYSFISAKDMQQFGLESAGELANPLNPELAFLRPSLLPNLASVVASNGIVDPITVFEIGHVFTKQAETVRLGIALASVRIDVKGWVAKLAHVFDITTDQLTPILDIKELDQTLKDAYKIRKQQVVLIEMALDQLKAITKIEPTYRIPTDIPVYKPLSKFPPVTRDIAIVVDLPVDSSDVTKQIMATEPRVEAADLFDEFSSDTLGVGKKSLAFHIYYADPTHTLSNDEATVIHSKVQQSLIDTFKATIR